MRLYNINGNLYPSATTIIKPYKDRLYGKGIDPTFLKKRADIGTETHKIIEECLKGNKPQLNLELESHRYAAQLWPLISTYRVRAFEKVVYSTLGYAGRFDFLVWDDELGSYVMVDIKTTMSRKPDLQGYAMQVAAYAKAFCERAKVDKCLGRLLVAHPRDLTVYELDNSTIDFNFKRFRHYLDVWYEDAANLEQLKKATEF